MELKLKVLSGSNTGREIPITGDKFLIGRAEGCQLRPASDMVSRRHCMIEMVAAKATVRDLGSRNGTLVNGERIPDVFELQDGDRLVVGPLEFEVQISLASPKKRPKVKDIRDVVGRTASGSDEFDVLGWIEGGGGSDVNLDTREIRVEPVPDESPEPLTSETQMDAVGRPPKGEPGKLPPGKAQGPVGTNSRDAAAEILKKHYMRRR